MSDRKREAIELIERLPDGVDLADIIAELTFKLKVDAGLRDLAAGRIVSHDELRERWKRWRISAGR